MHRLILSLVMLWPFVAHAAEDAGKSVFITLGTVGGPVGDTHRSQPANALINGDAIYLVDAGDGAVVQLARSGIPLPAVQGVFLSHLHFDHSAGVLGLLGLRIQINQQQRLNIYGPPGTQAFVEGLLLAMQPVMEAAYGFPGQHWITDVVVTELTDGSTVKLDGLTVTAAENTHFSFPAGSPEAGKFKSLSYRFDLADRSIVYTGDTGISESLQKLATGADLLVSEMIDVEKAMAGVKRTRPDAPEGMLAGIERHFSQHHLSPQQVGELAAAAQVGALVITHMVPTVSTAAERQYYVDELHQYYKGEVTMADDLERF